MTLSIRKALLALALGSSVVYPLQAKNQDTNINEVRNEAGIMLNILKASLKQQRSSNKLRFRADSVFYLANQGVVFEIDSDRHGKEFFGLDLGGLNGLISNVVSTSSSSSSSSQGQRVEIKIDENEIEKIVTQFIGHGDFHDDDISDKMRELSEEKRELGWEQREYERTRRDLEFEKRNADSERRKQIDSRISKLNKDVIKLKAKSKELEKYKGELEAERNQELAKREAAQKKLYSESLALFEDTIGDMLCSYGAGLRSLADDENITFLLSEFIDADNDSVLGSHDKVYVFKHEDVKACVTGKSSKNELLLSANTYLF